jgi:hypothetical protein
MVGINRQRSISTGFVILRGGGMSRLPHPRPEGRQP